MQTFTIPFIILVCLAALSAAYDSECPSEGFAQLPHPNCSLFIVCVHGRGSEIQCPTSLYYSAELGYCDYEQNVPDCVGGTRAPIGDTTTQRLTEQPTTQRSTQRPTTSRPNPTTTPRPNVLTQCGDSITALSGSIEYKLNANYDANELCVFIIRSQRDSKLTLQLEADGISGVDSNAITILSYHDDVNGISVFARLSRQNPTVTIPNGVAIVVFRTNGNTGTGFKIDFLATEDSVWLPGMNKVYNTNEISPLQLPIRSNNTEKEYDITVITSEAKQITEESSSLQLVLKTDNPFDFCNDRLIIWKLDGNDVVGYVPCGEGDQIYETRGMYIITTILNEETAPARGTLSWGRI
ncbi:unnamed protein product [Orchesella dallaii]|uniref:Chitin-binding type-2 domain-containing protein n=1 Tax=Orchesella dallaii TaxID=48710 RepID=A0ABP1RLW6_9HEXA